MSRTEQIEDKDNEERKNVWVGMRNEPKRQALKTSFVWIIPINIPSNELLGGLALH